MTSAIIRLLRNKVVQVTIVDLCVGIAIGIAAKLKKKEKNEISKRVLLHMQEGPLNSRTNGQKKEMRYEVKGNKVGEEREGWSRKRSSKRDYL